MSPILSEAIAKARRSLPEPKTRAQAERRAALYERFTSAPGRRSAGGKARIAIAQAEGNYLRTRTRMEDNDEPPANFARNAADRDQYRMREEKARAKAISTARRKQDKNNDGWVDGQKPAGAKPRKTATANVASLRAEDISPDATRNGQRVGAKVSDAKASLMAISRLESASLRQMAKDNPTTLNWALDTKMTLPQLRRVHQNLTGKKLPETAGLADHKRAIRAALPDMGGAGQMRAQAVRDATAKEVKRKRKTKLIEEWKSLGGRGISASQLARRGEAALQAMIDRKRSEMTRGEWLRERIRQGG